MPFGGLRNWFQEALFIYSSLSLESIVGISVKYWEPYSDLILIFPLCSLHTGERVDKKPAEGQRGRFWREETSPGVSEGHCWGKDEVRQHDTYVSTWKPQQDLPTALCESFKRKIQTESVSL